MPTVRIQEKNYSESIMVLKLKDGPAQPKEIGEILKTMKNEMAEILPGEKPVTCSIGVIPVEKEYSIDALYRNADRLLYEAKKNGKNKVVFGYRFY